MNNELQQLVATAVQDSFGIVPDQVEWQQPADSQHGDLATPVALQLAKKAGKNPRELADAIVSAISASELVERAEVAGPGYVNIWLASAALLQQLSAVDAACSPQPKRNDQPVIVEYSQPNIAKPLGAHHLLTTLIGQAIANLYEHAGYNVVKWNYMGDWGTQFGKLAVAVQRWGDGRPASDYTVDELLELYVKFHQEAETDPTLEDDGRAAFRALEAGDKDLRAFWTDVVAVTKGALGALYERLHVSFDTDISESFYEDKMQPILEQGRKDGVFTEGENGSLIVTFPEATNYPPYLVQKSDGATLYSTRDIAQMRYRIDEYNPQGIYIVTDIAQKLHFEQLVATCQQLGWQLPDFENVLSGRMRFADKSMSTRKGNVLKLAEVLDEAVERAAAAITAHGDSIQTSDPEGLAEMMGIGAVAYGILNQNRKMDIVFDWDKMLSFDGNSAPYLQYTHARAKSVLRKAGVSPDLSVSLSAVELEPADRALVNRLLQFPEALRQAREARMPHILANELYTLCQSFNSFYNAVPILKADEPLQSLRLQLTALTARVLRCGAELLTLRVPDEM